MYLSSISLLILELLSVKKSLTKERDKEKRMKREGENEGERRRRTDIVTNAENREREGER